MMDSQVFCKETLQSGPGQKRKSQFYDAITSIRRLIRKLFDSNGEADAW